MKNIWDGDFFWEKCMLGWIFKIWCKDHFGLCYESGKYKPLCHPEFIEGWYYGNVFYTRILKN